MVWNGLEVYESSWTDKEESINTQTHEDESMTAHYCTEFGEVNDRHIIIQKNIEEICGH